LIFIIPKEFYFMNVFLPNQPLIKHVTSTSWNTWGITLEPG
jgi:hypothetical protein